MICGGLEACLEESVELSLMIIDVEVCMPER